MPDAAPLLTPAELDRLSRLRLRAHHRVAGRYHGGHRARHHGTSLDFDDYRPYQPGDDPRTVDRHAHQRLGRLLVKLFEAEDEAAVQLVVDTSRSMAFGHKARTARRLAAAIGTIALVGGDRVRVTTVGGGGGRAAPGPWLRGRAALPVLHRGLAEAPDAGPGTLTDALALVLPASRRGSVVAVTDLLVPDHDAVLDRLGAARAGAVLLQVLGRDDLDPPVEADARLVDADDGVEVETSVTPQALAAFASRRDAWLDAVRQRCAGRGIAFARALDDTDPLDLVFRALPDLGVVA